MTIIISIGGLAIGMCLGGVVLLAIINSARKQCREQYEREEELWNEHINEEEENVSDE